MRKIYLLYLGILSGCVVDLTGLKNHPVKLPENTLVIVSVNIPSFYAYIMDIEKMEIIDSLCLSYYFNELYDFEYLSPSIIKTSKNFISYCVTFKYHHRYIFHNIVRIVNPQNGEIVKEIKVGYRPGFDPHPFYINNHKYVIVGGYDFFSVLDLTTLKCISEFKIDGYMGYIFQDLDGCIYYICKFQASPIAPIDSAYIRRVERLNFQNYENILKIDTDNAMVYNKKIYLIYNEEGLIKVYDFGGNLLNEKRFSYPYYPFHYENIINGYIIVSCENGWLLKVDLETLEYKAVKLQYGVSTNGIAYSRKLGLLFTTCPILGSYFHIYYIDFENFEIVGEYVDYNRRDGWTLEVLE